MVLLGFEALENFEAWSRRVNMRKRLLLLLTLLGNTTILLHDWI